ncbi:unnamed protein product [Diplocarpon coronariae]|uniref:Uncharacterized protein n=1 Tax=Diplocarpon coronariae TaxID=2795749 RepID=A0A218Z141_9HELO|nr:hypothetical protein B2J93_5543 [Marssonina coronariae]
MFLDFDSLPKYQQNGAFISLGPKVTGTPLESRAVMHNVVKGFSFHPIVTNSPRQFSWLGLVHGLFRGKHFFRFEYSDELKGETVLTHGEAFSGLLGWMAGTGWLASRLGFEAGIKRGLVELEAFNRDFKGWCEKWEQ